MRSRGTRARCDFLATAATGKHLEDYVLGSDTAHVVVEWSGPSGRRLVTGAVYEWADRSQPADPNRDHDRLGARWYVFSPAAGRAELDLLPFTTDGKPTPMREFVAEIRRWDAIPGYGAAVTDGMDRWRRLLDEHGLDPEIFTPILQMNATEGGIEGQFQFRNADQVVEYLLELIVGAAAVKAPALLVLGFLGMEWVRRRGARLRDVGPAAVVLLAITVAIFMALAPTPDDTWGWMRTLSVPSLSTEWMSISTLSQRGAR